MGITPHTRTLTQTLGDLLTRVRSLELRGDAGRVTDRVGTLETDLDVAEADLASGFTTLTASRPMGNKSTTMGTYVSGRRVRCFAGWSATTTDAAGLVTVYVPAGTVCVVSMFIQPMIVTGNEVVWGAHVRIDGTNPFDNGILFQVRKLDTGGFYPSVNIAYCYQIYYQGAN